ncbi:MAG: DoxX family protein [Robiginitomaculum sp.]|nr:DoxX family protein [Robiginitomaculum sp.]
MRKLINKLNSGFANKSPNILMPVVDLFVRIIMAREFFSSGLAKFKSLEDTTDLFQYEWFSDENWWMTLIDAEEIPRVLATLLAVLATAGELILPVILVVGLLTRYAATGLMVMALVITLLVYPVWTEDGLTYWWSQHVWWIMGLSVLMIIGGQKFSIDSLMER